SIPDAIMKNWFEMVTPLPEERINSLTNAGEVHPRQAKDILARLVVEQYYSAADAEKASEDFRRRFTEHAVLADTEVKHVPAAALADGKIGVLNLMKVAGFAASNSEARRLVEGGAVSVNGEKVGDPKAMIA